jgi:hypothetical protein
VSQTPGVYKGTTYQKPRPHHLRIPLPRLLVPEEELCIAHGLPCIPQGGNHTPPCLPLILHIRTDRGVCHLGMCSPSCEWTSTRSIRFTPTITSIPREDNACSPCDNCIIIDGPVEMGKEMQHHRSQTPTTNSTHQYSQLASEMEQRERIYSRSRRPPPSTPSHLPISESCKQRIPKSTPPSHATYR